MKSILYVGMDVHILNYTLCCYDFEKDEVFAITTVQPDVRHILSYLERVKRNYPGYEILCGYEAGTLGYSLHRQLLSHGIHCIILAPTTMPRTSKQRIKTDRRDAANIARCLAYNTYGAVYVPTEEDNAVKEYIRMRDDEKDTLKKLKQRILSFCARHGKHYTEGSNWTQKHLAWINKLDFGQGVLQEAFREYLALFYRASESVALFDRRIEELAQGKNYNEKVRKLICFIGVKAHTALAAIVETGDFNRFRTADHYASYLGLVPGENSSGSSTQRTGITKAGNSHVRKLLIEAAQCYGRGRVGTKSKALAVRQAGNERNVIAYADKANDRLRRKFYKIMFRSKRNIAATAVARELACFFWGMMTGNIA